MPVGMFSSLSQPKRHRHNEEQRPLLAEPSDVSPFGPPRVQPPTDYFQQPSLKSQRIVSNPEARGDEDEDDILDEDHDGGHGENSPTPLLPIFSAAHLDAIPVYNLTHTIRLLIIKRCETTLSWDQIRTPQISQFLAKPIQEQIQTSHLTRATIYALLANCLQFNKEAQNNAGDAGVSRTRGLLAELIAMRLLKEFSTRELIDCLSYDFDPLRGDASAEASKALVRLQKSATRDLGSRQGITRTSALEVGIRAQAKRFLAHRLVVQHLEAVWAGNIVFHSAADSLHRYSEKPLQRHARTYGGTHSPPQDVPYSRQKPKRLQGEPFRRSVSLYNPGDASLFKLSRLRVPRYRQLFSTLSYAIMLGLFLAILTQQSIDITAVEVVFWFWSAGFMLDEIVGFTEQGFGLYILSVWNVFDLGILLMFMIYYVLRLYGIIVAQTHRHKIAYTAYDVLASTAILLFPRLFSYLDHYKYFSQLLIAFRMMALDLMAILVLIVISCSGFFVAFSTSFGQTDLGGPSGVSYALFQIVMGFTPAAWAVWDQYNLLGKALLGLFLIICHFLVITILITVLTNSFMKVVQNANEEHQYLFAVNTLSMVKSDALFSYIAPINILGWLFSPLRYVLPFRKFVKLNRTLIKATHFPILFSICGYERLFLAHYAWEPTELIEQRSRRISKAPAFAMNITGPFSPSHGVREPSIRTFYKDQALDAVFRHPFNEESTIRKVPPSAEREANVVDRWINGVGADGGASPPMEQPRSILEQLENRRPKTRRAFTTQANPRRRGGSSSASRSVLSDPERRIRPLRRPPQPISEEGDVEETEVTATTEPHPRDEDLGDDEQATTAAEDTTTNAEDEDDRDQSVGALRLITDVKENVQDVHEEDMPTPTGPRAQPSVPSGPVSNTPPLRCLADNVPISPGLRGSPVATASPGKSSASGHGRHASSTTIVYRPPPAVQRYSSSSNSPQRRPRAVTQTRSGIGLPSNDMLSSSRRPPNSGFARPRPTMPARGVNKTTPNVQRFLELAARNDRRAPSFDAIALDLASEVGHDRQRERGEYRSRRFLESLMNDETHFIGPLGVPHFQEMHRRESTAAEESNRINRMMLARMNTLESGFKDMLREVKDWKLASSSRGTSANEGPSMAGSVAERRLLRRIEKKRDSGFGSRPDSRGGLKQSALSSSPVLTPPVLTPAEAEQKQMGMMGASADQDGQGEEQTSAANVVTASRSL